MVGMCGGPTRFADGGDGAPAKRAAEPHSPFGLRQNNPDRLETAAGGDGRARTGDPLLAKQVLSQLSYIPEYRVVGLSGFEPETSRLSAVRSHQLS